MNFTKPHHYNVFFMFLDINEVTVKSTNDTFYSYDFHNENSIKLLNDFDSLYH